jgi:hypothetical protein
MGGDSASGDAASDAGYVVGLWPGLAVDASGETGLVYKDIHFGTLQHDDQYRADLEFASGSGGSWSHEVADLGNGAGDHSQLLFDDEGRAIAVYAIPVQEEKDNRLGLWAARRESDGTWTTVQLHGSSAGNAISAKFSPSGQLVVAFYSGGDQAVKIRTLTDPDSFGTTSAWDSELVASNRFDEGEYVSLDFLPDGRRALAYRRCKLLTDKGDGCNINDEAVVFAAEGSDGWEFETVQAGEDGSCGEYTNLVIDPSGKATIVYRCTVEDSGTYSFRLFTATRDL